MDFDGDGFDDIAVSGGNNGGEYGDPGVSHLGLFVGSASGFTEVARRIGLDEAGDFQSLIADDLDRDGRPDLLVGHFAGLPRLYLNRLTPRGGMVAVELRGPVVENLEVEFIGSESVWVMRSGAQSQPLTGARPMLFRGVGREQEVLLRVHWPSGPTEMQLSPRVEPWFVNSPGSSRSVDNSRAFRSAGVEVLNQPS